MRWHLLLLALPLALAACEAEPDDTVAVEAPVPPPPPAPAVAMAAPAPEAVAPATPAETPLVSQCENLFAQSLAGQSAAYSAPSITAVGEITTVRLAANTSSAPEGPPVTYTCTFNGESLTSAGQS